MANNDNDNNCKLHQLERNNYFYGKLMTVRDFEQEQKYMNEKRSLINRLIHGAGIVCGFYDIAGKIDIVINDNKITFKKGGVALDCCGHEIVVPDGGTADIVDELGHPIKIDGMKYLYLKYSECKGENVNAASNASSCDETCCPNRIFEGFKVVASSTPPNILPVTCPTLTLDITKTKEETIKTKEQIKEEIKEKTKADIKLWARDSIKECPPCNDPKTLVFIAVAVVNAGKLEIDTGKTVKNISFVYNNKLLADLLNCHISDYNPHKTLISVDGVTGDDKEYNIDLEKANAISIDSTSKKNTIIIGEDHSTKINQNPHKTKHSQLENVKGRDGSNTNHDENQELHISQGDAGKWDKAIRAVQIQDSQENGKVGHIKYIDVEAIDGKISLKEGKNITITSTPDVDNGITIASTAAGGGGAECYTGVVVGSIGEGSTPIESSEINLTNVHKLPLGIILGLEADKQQIIGDIIRSGYRLELSARLRLIDENTFGLTVIVQNYSKKPFPNLMIRWWAITPMEKINDGKFLHNIEKDVSDDFVFGLLASGSEMTVKEIIDKYSLDVGKINTRIDGLAARNAIKVEGTGDTRKIRRISVP